MSEIVSVLRILKEITSKIENFFNRELFDLVTVEVRLDSHGNVVVLVKVPEHNRVHDVTVRNIGNIISETLVDVKFECFFVDNDIVLEFRGRVPTDSEE